MPQPPMWFVWPAGALEDDALLEAVVLLGALAGWEEGDRQLAGSGLVSRWAACGLQVPMQACQLL